MCQSGFGVGSGWVRVRVVFGWVQGGGKVGLGGGSELANAGLGMGLRRVGLVNVNVVLV